MTSREGFSVHVGREHRANPLRSAVMTMLADGILPFD
jgi:hypothetical protein